MITKPDESLSIGNFHLVWNVATSFYDVYYYGRSDRHICQVHPYKQEKNTISQPGKMFTIKAVNYPGIGNLEQMVKQQDLFEYIDSLRIGRGW